MTRSDRAEGKITAGGVGPQAVGAFGWPWDEAVIRRRTVCRYGAALEIDSHLGGTEGRSVEGGGIQTGRWLSGLEEMPDDLEDLRGVGDDGDDLHRTVTLRTVQRAPAGLRSAAT
jgi:hypothetical protein